MGSKSMVAAYDPNAFFRLITDKTEWVFFNKNIPPEAVCNSKASSAYRMELTGVACRASCTVPLCLRRIVYFCNALAEYIPDW